MKKMMVGMVFVLSIMLFFVACSGGVPAEEFTAIDISDPEVFDEYVDINGSTTPSDYSSEAKALALEPFTQTLTLDFKPAVNTEFSVLFNNKDYSVDSGELAIDITDVDSGSYPVTITTNAKAHQKRAQAQIWVQIDNGIIIPEIDLKWLEKDTATFSFTRSSEESQAATVSVYLRTQEGSNGTKETGVLLPANAETDVVLTGLTEEQSYEIGIRRTGEQETNWLASFRTFKRFEEGLQLFYWLDLTKPETHKVGVKIFGYYENLDNLSFIDDGFHYSGGEVNASDFNFISSPEISVEFKDDDKEILFDLSGITTGFFALSYLSDRGFISKNGNWLYGFFDEEFLMASNEMLLYKPNNDSIDSLKTENNKLCGLHLYAKINEGWSFVPGWEESLFDIFTFHPYYVDQIGEFFLAGGVFAYKEDAFNVIYLPESKSNFQVIATKKGHPALADDIVKLYQIYVEIFDKEFELPSHTIMISPPPDDDDSYVIGGPEWLNGNGNSSPYYGKHTFEGTAHGLYHLWNGWRNSISWDEQGPNWGFWIEGFNDFYVDKVLNKHNFQSFDYEEHSYLKGAYRAYSKYRGTDEDLPILYGGAHEHLPNNLEYNKGATLAFLMEKEILAKSNGKITLDDLVKHLYIQYDVAGTTGSYEEMLLFFRAQVDGGIDDWWQAYLLNNEPVYLYEFEENPPSFSVVNPTPENRAQNINHEVTLSWKTDNPENKTLQYDLYIQKLYRDVQEPMEPKYTGLDNPSKTLTLENGTKYIWRVKAYDNEGNEYMTPVWFFETE